MVTRSGAGPIEVLVDAAGVRPLTDDRLVLGEGLRRLDDGSVVLVDLLAGRLLRLPDGPGRPLVEVLRVDGPLGAVAPVAGRPGSWLAAVGDGFAVLDAAGGPRWLGWLDRPAQRDGRDTPPRRVNDAVVDPSGALWAGLMATDESAGAGTLHRVARDGSVALVLDGLTVPNGPAFDGSVMYLSDTPQDVIEAFDLDPATGALSGRRVFARTDELPGHPDGMVVDVEGRLWAAMHGGSCLACFERSGALLGTVALPVSQPTSIAFTGEHVLVTTKIDGLDEVGPLDGAVLALPSPVRTAPTPHAVLDP